MTYAERLEQRVRESHRRLDHCDRWEETTSVETFADGRRYRLTGIGCAEHHVVFQRVGDPPAVRAR